MKKTYCIFITTILLLSANVFAKGGISNLKNTDNKPVKVTANQMVSEDNGKIIIFSDNVVTKKGDMKMMSDRLKIYNEENDDKKESRLSKIIATGHVKIDNKGKYAEGDKAIYFEKEEKIELLGNVRAWEENNIISGEKMIMFLNDEKVKVTGNVNVTFYPKKDEGKDVKVAESTMQEKTE